MNIAIILLLIFAGLGLVAGVLYFVFRKKDSTPSVPPSIPTELATVIRFQTTCDIKFILCSDDGKTLYENLLFSPKLNYSYEAHELAKDMSGQATVNGFPLLVSFENGLFTIFCTDLNKKLLVIDQEFDSTITTDLDYVSQYGAVQRFLNHLYITWPISYFPTDVQTPVKEVQSTQNLTGMIISLDEIPHVPSNLVATPESYSIAITWTPIPECKTGIFLKDDTSEKFQNWDLIPENIGTYTFEGLPVGTYTVGISAVGRFDESSMLIGNPVYVVEPVVTIHTLDFTNGSNINKLTSGTLIYNEYAIATDFANANFQWPAGLTKTSQIINIKIKYYMQLISDAGTQPGYYPTLPSDSRIEMECGATSNGTAENYALLDYMYWKTVIPQPKDPPVPPNVYIFGSTEFSGTNQGGPSLPWETKIITDPNVISLVFPSDSNGDIISKLPPNLRFFCGYLSNQIQVDNSQVPIDVYSIEWVVL